jgi:hypothetical protein
MGANQTSGRADRSGVGCAAAAAPEPAGSDPVGCPDGPAMLSCGASLAVGLAVGVGGALVQVVSSARAHSSDARERIMMCAY